MDIRLVSHDVAWIAEGTLCEACSIEHLAMLCDVTCATARRWCRARAAPALVEARLRAVVLGLLPQHKRWVGWSIDPADGRLWSPAGAGFMPPEIEHIGHQRGFNQVLRDELATLELEVKKLTSRLNHAGGVFSAWPSRLRRPLRAGNPS